MISRGETSPTDLSSAEAILLVEAFRSVPLLYQHSPQCLTHLVVRLYPDRLMRVVVRTRGPDF